MVSEPPGLLLYPDEGLGGKCRRRLRTEEMRLSPGMFGPKYTFFTSFLVRGGKPVIKLRRPRRAGSGGVLLHRYSSRKEQPLWRVFVTNMIHEYSSTVRNSLNPARNLELILVVSDVQIAMLYRLVSMSDRSFSDATLRRPHRHRVTCLYAGGSI